MTEQATSLRSSRFFSSLSELEDTNRKSIIECMKNPLLSLEEALASVTEFVPDVGRYAAKAKKSCKQNSSLTVNESAAIYLYTMSEEFYRNLNKALRNQNPSLLKKWHPYLKLFLTALNKLPSCSTTVWRGVPEQIGDEFEKGAVHTWSSVNSCSPDVDVARVFAGPTGTLLCIHQIRGIDIARYSMNKSEKEIILLPETHLRVQSTQINSDGLSTVNLEEWWVYINSNINTW